MLQERFRFFKKIREKGLLRHLFRVRSEVKYVSQSCVTVLLSATICLFLVFSGPVADANTRAAADDFLKQLLVAEHYGMGGSFVGGTRGANALGNNPAGMSGATGNRFVLQAVRFPDVVAVLSKPNLDANYEEYSRYEEAAYGAEILSWAFPVGRFGALGLGVAFEQEGSFRRVDHEGRALNSFPENNLAMGLSYGVNIFGGTSVGVDAKWLRSKVVGSDGTESFGHGYAYNVGVSQRIGERFHIGAVVRNLSNGLSFSDASIPRTMERTFVAGIAYRREISDVALRVGLDARPPFSDGLRLNVGAELWYRSWISVRVGYMRDIQERSTAVFILGADSFESEARLWKAEGLSFGLGFRFKGLIFNAAYTPQFTPVVAAAERIHIVEGAGVYAFSLGQAF